jgi:uncharacterized membrane protein
MNNKQRITHVILLVIISVGLLIITQSFWMSLGILILIVLGDFAWGRFCDKLERKKREKEETED